VQQELELSPGDVIKATQ